jgi:hypothetical protein
MTSPTKLRRTKAAVQALRDVILELVAEYRPMTVRQVFYQLVTRGEIGKTENEYKTTVCRLLVQMRRDGSLPWQVKRNDTPSCATSRNAVRARNPALFGSAFASVWVSPLRALERRQNNRPRATSTA